jgi:NitT/TauT family transport system substrate-binding protein
MPPHRPPDALARTRALWIASIVMLLAPALGIVGGCDRAQGKLADDAARAAPAASPAPAPAEVRIGYFANLAHAQAVLGVASGEYAAAVAPAKLTPKVFNAGPALIEAMFAGEIDLGYVGPGPALSAYVRSRGEGIRIIAGAAANGVMIVARKGSGITSLADLRGRRLATPQHGNTQDIAARHYLSDVLKQENLSSILAVPNAEQSAMMARGQIDAAWAPEPWAARLIAQTGATVIAEEKDLWPGKEFSLTVVVTTPDFLAAHPEVIRKLLIGHRALTMALQQDPQSQVQPLNEALAALTGQPLPRPVLSAALMRVKFTNDPLIETLETMGQWSYNLEFIQRPPKIHGLVDTSILDGLERE